MCSKQVVQVFRWVRYASSEDTTPVSVIQTAHTPPRVHYAGKIKPVIYKSFPLANAAEAHRLMETLQHIGKIVLTI